MSEWAGSDIASAGRAFAAVAAVIRREYALFAIGIGVVAVHIVDDNFVQPQPGTGATDHLVSGLVPLAVIASAAAGYGRLRAGFRAALALVFGFLGVLAGTEAAYYASDVGVSGDDYTGLLSIFAGLLLLSLGTVTLWRGRRTDDGLLRRYVRRLLLAVAAVAVLVFVLYPITLAYVFTHVAPADVPAPNLGVAYEKVQFRTSDGLLLKG
jgi:uncharacterized protein